MASESLIGNLAVLLTMETAAFEKGTSHATKLLRRTQREFEAVATKVVGIGQKMSLAITTPLVGFGAVAIKEATEAKAAMAQVDAALASMGPTAGRTAEQLKAASDAFELQSLFEGDEILKKVTANLLTFGNISGQAFDRAQQAALDLSARLGQDLQSSAVQVGKALNDPIKGVTALQRVGVSFTEAQREQIKAMVEAGNAAGAQSLILKELEKQFGGAALAAQNADPYNKATDAFKQMAETVGNALLPIIPIFTDAVVSVANAFSNLSPQTQKFLIIAGGIAAVLGPIAVVAGTLISAFGTMLPLLIKIGPAFLALKTVLTALGPVLVAVRVGLLALLANPIVLGAAAVITGIYLAWKNWDKIAPIVGRMVSAVTSFLQRLAAPFKWIIDKTKEVGDAFFRLYDRVVGNSYVPDMVDGIAAQMARLDAVMVKPVTAATGKAGEAFRQLQERTKGLLDQLFPEAAAQNQLAADIDTLKKAADKGEISVDQLREAILRLQQQMDQGSTGNGLPAGIETGPLSTETDWEEMGEWANKLPEIVDKTQQWKEALSEIGRELAYTIGDALSGLIEGSMTLKDLWRSVLSTALNFLTSPNGLSSIIGGARASGGPVTGGKAYLVGERGPELFMPGSSGSIVPNHQLGFAGGGVTMNIRTPDADSFRRSQGQIARQTRRKLGLG